MEEHGAKSVEICSVGFAPFILFPMFYFLLHFPVAFIVFCAILL